MKHGYKESKKVDLKKVAPAKNGAKNPKSIANTADHNGKEMLLKK